MDEEEKAFQEVLHRIEASQKSALEKKAFSTIAKLIFYNGLEQKEITNIRVGDVLPERSILPEITPTTGKGSTRLSEEVKQAIDDYLRELGSGSPVVPDSHLFPAYKGANGVRKLRRHFEEILGFLTFDELRRAGASHFYKILLESGVDKLTAEKEPARQFRLEKRTVDDILRGTTQPAGKKSPEKQNVLPQLEKECSAV
jgi:integrase